MPHGRGWGEYVAHLPTTRPRPNASPRSTNRAPLFHFSRWTAFGAGMAATVAASSVSTWVYGFLPPALLSYASFIAGLLVLTPLAWVIAVSMWRAESYRPMSARSSLLLGRGRGLRFLLRQSRVAGDVRRGDQPGRFDRLRARSSIELALAFVVLVSLALFVAWVRTTARAWLPFSDRPRRSLLGAALGASVVLVLWYAFISFSLESGIAGERVRRARPLLQVWRSSASPRMRPAGSRCCSRSSPLRACCSPPCP